MHDRPNNADKFNYRNLGNGCYLKTPKSDNRKYIVTNIEYDTDGEEVDLPKSLTVVVPTGMNAEEKNEYLSNKISDETGFCHKGFTTVPEIVTS